MASSNNLGVVKIAMDYGVGITEAGYLGIVTASNTNIKGGTNNAQAITPGR